MALSWSVIGHSCQKEHFRRALERGSFAHAYLVSGPEQIGKRSLISDVIRHAHPGTEPGVNDPFAILIAPDEHGTIAIKEHIRPLRKALSLRPPEGTRVFVLIDDADRMSFDATHAILRILEEPPSYVTFFLVTAAPGLLPSTIISRCHDVRCTPASEQQITEFLEQHGICQKHQRSLIRLAGGCIGWLQRVIEEKKIAKVIAADEELDGLLLGGIAERLTWAKTFAERDDARPQLVRWMHRVRTELAERPERSTVAHGLMELHDSLGRSSSNARLMVEHFLLQVR